MRVRISPSLPALRKSTGRCPALGVTLGVTTWAARRPPRCPYTNSPALEPTTGTSIDTSAATACRWRGGSITNALVSLASSRASPVAIGVGYAGSRSATSSAGSQAPAPRQPHAGSTRQGTAHDTGGKLHARGGKAKRMAEHRAANRRTAAHSQCLQATDELQDVGRLILGRNLADQRLFLFRELPHELGIARDAPELCLEPDGLGRVTTRRGHVAFVDRLLDQLGTLRSRPQVTRLAEQVGRRLRIACGGLCRRQTLEKTVEPVRRDGRDPALVCIKRPGRGTCDPTQDRDVLRAHIAGQGSVEDPNQSPHRFRVQHRIYAGVLKLGGQVAGEGRERLLPHHDSSCCRTIRPNLDSQIGSAAKPYGPAPGSAESGDSGLPQSRAELRSRAGGLPEDWPQPCQPRWTGRPVPDRRQALPPRTSAGSELGSAPSSTRSCASYRAANSKSLLASAACRPARAASAGDVGVAWSWTAPCVSPGPMMKPPP